MVFVDETGDEALKDPAHPLFGLGGCVIPLAALDDVVREPWRALKRRCGFLPTTPFHARDRKWQKPERQQLIRGYFRNQRFGRLAALVHAKTLFATGAPKPYATAASLLMARLTRLSSTFDFDHVQMIFESSARGDRLAAQHFSSLRLGPPFADVPITYNRMSKAVGEVGLEVADYVMWAAGRQVRRAHASGPEGPWDEDFSAVFREADDLADYFDTTEVSLPTPSIKIRGVLKRDG